MKIFNGLLVAALAVLAAACSDNATDKGAADKKADGVFVSMETSMGAVTFELYPEKAPITTANFLRYVDEGLYDGATFYRATRANNDPMITVIQGGLWQPWRDGDDDYEFGDRLPPIAHETTEVSGLTHRDGVISMARVEPGTASSEFFVSIGDNKSLDFGGERNPDGQGFAAFGQIVDGLDVVHAINAVATNQGEGFAGQIITEPVRIISVERAGVK